MTVSATYSPPQYSGNGATTAFSFPFQFFSPADLGVNLYDTAALANVAPQPVLNGAGTYDYTVVGVQDPNTGEYLAGALVTFNTAPLGNHRVTITRAVAAIQGVVLTNNSAFPAKTVEGALDRGTLVAQQQQSLLGFAMTAPTNDPSGLSYTLPASTVRANQYVGFDSAGNVAALAAPAGSTLVSSAMAPVVVAASLALALGQLAGGAAWAQGDVAIVDGSLHLARLAAGASGQVLTTKGGGATAVFAGVPAIAGSVRNLKIVQASTTTLTITADEAMVETALGATSYRGGSLAHTFNGATTGANAMDTGALPTSGFVSIYEIYNPATNTWACLGTVASQTTIYGGANLPSGYTASALIGIWPTDGSAHLIVATQLDRRFSFDVPVNISTGVTFASTLTSQSISIAVPAAAKAVSALMGVDNASTGGTQLIAADANGCDLQMTGLLGTGSASNILGFTGAGIFRDVMILTPQTIFIAVIGGGVASHGRFSVTGFTF